MWKPIPSVLWEVDPTKLRQSIRTVIFPHAGHLLSFLKVEERPLAVKSCLPSTGSWWSWPFSPLWRKSCSTTYIGELPSCTQLAPPWTAPWSAKATELWSLFSGPTQQLPETQLILQLDTMPSEKVAACMGELVSSHPLPAGPFWASVCFTTGAGRQC